MSNEYLRLKSNKPGAVGVVLEQAGATLAYSWKSPGWQEALLGVPGLIPQYSQAIGASHGARLIGETEDMREFQTVIGIDAANAGALVAAQSALYRECRDVSRWGGRLDWRSKNLSNFVHLDVRKADLANAVWSHQAEVTSDLRTTLAIAAQPYALGDPMGFTDLLTDPLTFSTGGDFNLLGSDWTIDSGTLGTPNTIGTTTTATTGRIRHTGTGYTWSDVQTTITYAPTTIASGKTLNLVLNYIDANNYLMFRATDNGTNLILRMFKVVAGATTQVGTDVTITRWIAGQYYHLRARVNGNCIWIEHHATTFPPLNTSQAATANQAKYVFTLAEATAASTVATSQDSTGGVGISWDTNASGAFILRGFAVSPYTYMHQNQYSRPHMDTLNGVIPGDVSALCSVEMQGANQSNLTKSAVVGWSRKPNPVNLVWNTLQQDNSLNGNTSGWSVASSGFNAAATSIAMVSVADFPGVSRAGQVVCPATTNTGAFFNVYTPHRLGQIYSFSAWVKSSGGSTTSIKLMAGDTFAGGTASNSVNLSTSWQKISGTLIITGGTVGSNIQVAAVINAATATTFQITNVMFYEGLVEPTMADGGIAPWGIIDGAACDTGNTGGFWTPTYGLVGRSGFALRGTGAMGATCYAEWYIIPGALKTWDEYSPAREVLVDVYARYRYDMTNQVTPTFVLSTLPDGGIAYGIKRYGSLGATGVTLPTNASVSVGFQYREAFLGTIALPSDPDRLKRWKLRIDGSNGGTSTQILELDCLVLVPNSASFTTVSRVDSQSADYAGFYAAPQSATNSARYVRDDLSGELVTEPTGRDRGGHSVAGLRGSQILFPQGEKLETVIMLGATAIDDPNNTNSLIGDDVTYGETYAWNPTPRYLVAR